MKPVLQNVTISLVILKNYVFYHDDYLFILKNEHVL